MGSGSGREEIEIGTEWNVISRCDIERERDAKQFTKKSHTGEISSSPSGTGEDRSLL